MYARVTQAELQPGNVDELLQFLQDNVVPAAQAQQGFKGLLLLTDETTNKGIAVALWEAEADLAASGSPDSYYTKQMVRGAHFFAAPPVIESYQVTLQVQPLAEQHP